MKITEIRNLLDFEKYILEQNYLIKAEDDGILQSLAYNLFDQQLFFIIKSDKWAQKSLDELMYILDSYISGKYTTYIKPSILRVNAEGDIWVNKNFNVVKYENVWKKLDEAFPTLDMQTLYDDENIRVILVKNFITSISLGIDVDKNKYYQRFTKESYYAKGCDLFFYNYDFQYEIKPFYENVKKRVKD